MSRALYPLILVLCAGVFGSGCAKDTSTGSLSEGWVETKTLESAQQLAHEAVVRCDGANCSESVGMLLEVQVGQDNYQTGRCTMSLVEPDLVMTNRHCIPDDLKSAGSACAGRIWAVFPDTGAHRAETLECDHIEAIAPQTGSSEEEEVKAQDYAFVRLASKSTRPTLVLSASGMKDSETVTITKVNPDSSTGLDGLMEIASCAFAQRLTELPSFTDAMSPVGTLRGCGVIPGNSGSPLTDELGRVHAIVQGVETQRVGDFTLELADFSTNVACMSVPDTLLGTTYLLPAACH